MPYKHSEERRHKFEKPLYKVTNWPEYNAALKRRGDFTMWFTEEAIAEWCPAKTGARGRPTKYSNVAIETALFIRQVFHLALRLTEGFMNSLARALKVEISIPDFSCISKRSIGLPRHAWGAHRIRKKSGAKPIHSSLRFRSARNCPSSTFRF
ncbi:transposase [Janthinobacterium aquaticum]|uniref:transposase n=1 Tax=Janthinobacterium sp. FT58W TaxID=2654254 RepID=UPI001264BF39|nr:transposase [Janthinobacterium sp. FT58W]KAB8037181.1 hypothetical protein GCM43_23965 [Janthinobacterium sp. FT58W]